MECKFWGGISIEKWFQIFRSDDGNLVFIGPRCPWGPIYGSKPMSVTARGFADLTDVTLADEDSNSIPTDDVNGQSQAMWQCKWRHLVAKIETNAS